MSPPKAHIDVYARVRPVKKPSGNLEVDYANSSIAIHMDKAKDGGLVNNQREDYSFAFTRILDATTTQEQAFDTIAVPVVDSVLEGYNGTIFAYGQTGSGKTFTITGGAERYADRGIIPRTLSYIFAKLAESSEAEYEVRISYLEIYNEAGYDLLDPSHETKGLEDLPKVSLQEDHDGKIHVRNLSAQLARSEEEALNLLFVGDTNRMISETPMNMASSRSHCIFTVNIEARKEGSDVVRRSKLHLVDLAGSERVKKTGIEGTVLREARYINLSLHYLEQVIIALQEKKFVPYRNSMMTSVLRDSLGGNCKTVMVATMNNEEPYLDETISTCRFAQRVALVANTMNINEEIDPKLLVGRLKAEIRELKEEIQMLRGEGYERAVEALSDEERQRCEQLVGAYLRESDPSVMLNPGEMAKIQLCFRLLRERATERKKQAVEAAGASGTEEANALLERNAAFEAFRRSYRKHEVIEDNKLLLKQKYDEAKRLGESVNAARAQINTLKGQIEACRRDRAISEVAASEGGEGGDGGGADTAAAQEEARLKMQMEEGKRTYKEGFAKLKELKGEIEHLQHLLEQSRRKLQQDFEGWYAKQQQAGALPPPAGHEGAATQQMPQMPQPPPQQQQQQVPIQPSPPRGSGAAAAAAAAASRGMAVGPAAQAAEIPGGGASPALVMPPKRVTLGGSTDGRAGGSPRRTPINPRVAPPAAYGSPPTECWGSPGKDKPSAPPEDAPNNPPPGAGGGGGPVLTGQPEVDKEIMAFYQARDSLVKQRMASKK